MARAAAFLDDVSLDWTRQHQCGTCHTNYPYLAARPSLKGPEAPAMAEVRRFFEDRVAHWDDENQEAKPRWDAEVVATATALAIHDAATTGRLHPLTRKALDRTWTLQKPAGGFDWLKCGWPPYEHDDYYGAVVAALGAGHAPDGYARTPAAREGLARLRAYLAATPPPDLHHATMLLWASTRLDGLITADRRDATISRLRAVQRPDGGWSLPPWGHGSVAMARPMIPMLPATDMPRACPSSSSARPPSARPTRPSGAASTGSSRTSASQDAGSRDPSTTTRPIT
jgi:squalene-hopene/tetraprenyl-beta-curcumene cyclase